MFNIRHRQTKAPLPLYFVDLEARENKSIIDLHFLCNMKIAVEAQWKKTPQYSALGSNLTRIIKPNAPDHLSVLNVVVTMIRHCIPKIPLSRRSAPFAVGPIQQIIKDVMSTADFRQLVNILPNNRGLLRLV